jgi:hypothetical protein
MVVFWYKFEAHHGAGHQSSHHKYDYFDHKLTEEEEKEQWEEWIETFYWSNSVTGEAKLVKVPVEVIAALLASARGAVERSQEKVALLEKELKKRGKKNVTP